MPRPLLFPSINWLVVIFLFSYSMIACDDDSLGDDHSDVTCLDTESSIGLDDQSSLRMTPSELLSEISGDWICDWQWYEGGDIASLEPMPGVTTVVISLTYHEGAILDTKSERTRDDGFTSLACPDSLVIELRLAVESADGALAESWEVRGEMHDPYSLSILFHPTAFNGSYRYETVDTWAESQTDFSLYVDVENQTVRGSLVEWNASRSVGSDDEDIGATVTDSHGVAGRTTAEWRCEREQE